MCFLVISTIYQSHFHDIDIDFMSYRFCAQGSWQMDKIYVDTNDEKIIFKRNIEMASNMKKSLPNIISCVDREVYVDVQQAAVHWKRNEFKLQVGEWILWQASKFVFVLF